MHADGLKDWNQYVSVTVRTNLRPAPDAAVAVGQGGAPQPMTVGQQQPDASTLQCVPFLHSSSLFRDTTIFLVRVRFDMRAMG